MTERTRKSAAIVKKTTKTVQPTSDDLKQKIQISAQKVFEDRRERHIEGDEISDWLKAEAAVKGKYKL